MVVKKMNTSLRTVKACLILMLFLCSSMIIVSPVSAERDKLFSFPSYIDIDYDPTPLNEDLAIDKSINVPIDVIFKTDIPTHFGTGVWSKFWKLRNTLIFGSMIPPMHQIRLEIVDSPDWADIYFSQSDIFTDIPFEGEREITKTSLIISPREEAPAQPQSIVIKATSSSVGRVQSREVQVSIPFTPSFIPTITINPEEPTRTVNPRETVNFRIFITNTANKKIRVTPQLAGSYTDWSPTINPPFLDIEAGKSAEFIYSVYSPFDFGWHNKIESFQIDFTAQIFPIRENVAVGGPYSIYLRVNNYGFSTPGFEMIILLGALIIAGYLIKKQNEKKI
jgi:hypothetical protein